MSKRDEILRLARDNPAVYMAVSMHDLQGVPWVEAMETLVVELARQNAKYIELLTEVEMRRPTVIRIDKAPGERR